LYFTLHVHAAYFGLLAVTAMIGLVNVKTLSNALSLIGPILLIAYTLVAFHTAYGGRWRLAAGRTMFVLSAYTLVIITATLITTVALSR
jgi:hypothetical protein